MSIRDGTAIGVAGCGAMGLPMAENLLAAGFDVWGFDVKSVPASDNLKNRMIADPAAFAAITDTVISVVRNIAETEALLFDEQATELIATTDLVAERVRKLGQDTLTSIGAIAAKQRINDHDSTSTDAPKMLKELHADNETLIKALKDAKDLADKAGDNATDGLLDDWTDQAEQRAWFLAATIGKA